MHRGSTTTPAKQALIVPLSPLGFCTLTAEAVVQPTLAEALVAAGRVGLAQLLTQGAPEARLTKTLAVAPAEVEALRVIRVWGVKAASGSLVLKLMAALEMAVEAEAEAVVVLRVTLGRVAAVALVCLGKAQTALVALLHPTTVAVAVAAVPE